MSLPPVTRFFTSSHFSFHRVIRSLRYIESRDNAPRREFFGSADGDKDIGGRHREDQRTDCLPGAPSVHGSQIVPVGRSELVS